MVYAVQRTFPETRRRVFSSCSVGYSRPCLMEEVEIVAAFPVCISTECLKVLSAISDEFLGLEEPMVGEEEQSSVIRD
jgi:hypothetical protein